MMTVSVKVLLRVLPELNCKRNKTDCKCSHAAGVTSICKRPLFLKFDGSQPRRALLNILPGECWSRTESMKKRQDNAMWTRCNEHSLIPSPDIGYWISLGTTLLSMFNERYLLCQWHKNAKRISWDKARLGAPTQQHQFLLANWCRRHLAVAPKVACKQSPLWNSRYLEYKCRWCSKGMMMRMENNFKEDRMQRGVPSVPISCMQSWVQLFRCKNVTGMDL